MSRRLALSTLTIAGLALVSLLAGLAPVAQTQSPTPSSVTIYSQDLAFVREQRTLDFGKDDTAFVRGLPERIDCIADALGNLDAHRFTVQNTQHVLCRNVRVPGQIQNGRHCKQGRRVFATNQAPRRSGESRSPDKSAQLTRRGEKTRSEASLVTRRRFA